MKDDGNIFLYYKKPPTKKERKYFQFLKQMHDDFGFTLKLSMSSKELLEVDLFPEISVPFSAEQKLQEHGTFPIYINLQGAPPAHAVVASVFMPMGERQPTFLFTDSWNNRPLSKLLSQGILGHARLFSFYGKQI